MEYPDHPPISQDGTKTLVAVNFLTVSVSEINAFQAEDELNTALSGEVELRASKGIASAKTLLVKVANEHLPRLLAVTQLCGHAVTTAAIQPSVSVPRGLIRCHLLRTLNCEDILNRLKDQGVTGVRKLVSALDPKREPGYVLSFKGDVVPEKIKVCGMRLPVGVYTSPPLRCYGCQRYGHVRAACTRGRACPRCATPHDGSHDEAACTLPPRCVSCRGPHDSRAVSCPQYRREANAKRLAKTEGVSVADAKVLLTQQIQKPPRSVNRTVDDTVSYAHVTGSTPPAATNSPSCQCSSLESRVASLESLAATVSSLAQTVAQLTHTINILVTKVDSLLDSADSSGSPQPVSKKKRSVSRKTANRKNVQVPLVDATMEDTDSSTSARHQQ